MSCDILKKRISYEGYREVDHMAGLFGISGSLIRRQDTEPQYGILREHYTNKEQPIEGNSTSVNHQMKKLLRQLDQKPRKEETQEMSILERMRQEEEEDLFEEEKQQSYNFKEVEVKIQRAKTPLSAAQAVISAKRKVAEVKRKLANTKGDTKALEQALIHAKRMELVARRKKHHLEMEEYIEHGQKLEENSDAKEKAVDAIREMSVTEGEEKIRKQLDELLEDAANIMDQTSEDLIDSLEETLEALEELEIADPHMSREDLEKLKLKHRNSENRDMIRADMDYLKNMAKINTPSGSPEVDLQA